MKIKKKTVIGDCYVWRGMLAYVYAELLLRVTADCMQPINGKDRKEIIVQTGKCKLEHNGSKQSEEAYIKP